MSSGAGSLCTAEHDLSEQAGLVDIEKVSVENIETRTANESDDASIFKLNTALVIRPS